LNIDKNNGAFVKLSILSFGLNIDKNNGAFVKLLILYFVLIILIFL
jgi:hypothetical protein